MIRHVAFMESVTVPGRISTLTSYNRTEHGKWISIKETNYGLVLCVADNDGKAVGDVEVFRHMIKHITREPAKAEAPKDGGKK